MLLVAFLLLARAQKVTHQVELSDVPEHARQAAIDLFAQLGANAQQASAIIAHVADKGPAVVIEGPQNACEAILQQFQAAGMAAQLKPKLDAPISGDATESATQQHKPQQSNQAAVSMFADTAIELLDEETLRREVLNGEANPSLVMFFAPWCGHCHKTIPELQKAALRLRGGVRVAAVNCDGSQNLAAELGIKGYPTIKFFSRGRATDYAGPRSALALVSFAQNSARMDGVRAGVAKALGGLKMALSRIAPQRDATV